MRYAFISDIHANLEAFTAVLDEIGNLRADEIYCLGDSVGYNANPNECLAILRSEGIGCILGNHDAVAAGMEEPDNFNPLAQAAAFWTRRQLTEENRAFLRELPRELQTAGFVLFHGSIHDTDRYILYQNDAADNFRLLDALAGSPRVGFFGHTHVQLALSSGHGAVKVERARELPIHRGKQYLLNPGSVGQPRDRDPRAAFLIYDASARTVVFHRTGYNITACQEKILRAGLPARLAERLAAGW